MPHSVLIAAVQMRSIDGDVPANLQKAGTLVAQAAAAGARLVVLPELYNTGYVYSDANYRLAEPPDGPTAGWIRATAARLQVHLAGTWLLRRQGEITNTLTLVAPDGRSWAYDKLCPWGWERAYFRPGRAPVVAETELGRLGFLTCWDTAQPRLFRAYAGQVQMLIVSSCPPAMGHMEILYPDGRTLVLAEAGRIAQTIRERSSEVFGADLRAQSAWLGVPMVNAMPHGTFTSAVPRPVASLALLALPQPRLWPLLWQARQARIRAPFNQHTLIAAADGRVLARAGSGDALAIATVDVPTEPPQPNGPQPKMRLPRTAYVLSNLLSWLSRPEYRRKARH